jgi:hypothetical protein
VTVAADWKCIGAEMSVGNDVWKETPKGSGVYKKEYQQEKWAYFPRGTDETVPSGTYTTTFTGLTSGKSSEVRVLGNFVEEPPGPKQPSVPKSEDKTVYLEQSPAVP